MSDFGGQMVGITERNLERGKSPVWGGITIALVVGVLAFVIAWVAGWDRSMTAFRSAAAVYAFFAVTSWPSWVASRRAGRIAPLIEPVGEAIVSVALIWVGFFAGLDGWHSVGWVFVAVMLFAAMEAYYGRRQFQAQIAGREIDSHPVLGVESRRMRVRTCGSPQYSSRSRRSSPTS